MPDDVYTFDHGKQARGALERRAAHLLRADDVAHVQAEVGGLVHQVGPRAVIDHIGARDDPHERAAEERRLGAAEDDGVALIICRSDFVNAFGREGRELDVQERGEPADTIEIASEIQ